MNIAHQTAVSCVCGLGWLSHVQICQIKNKISFFAFKFFSICLCGLLRKRISAKLKNKLEFKLVVVAVFLLPISEQSYRHFPRVVVYIYNVM